MNILIIEDENAAARRLEKMLGEIAPEAIVIDRLDSVQTAVVWLQNNQQPDLILLDLQMPEVNGFEVVAALQSSAGTARIPVLVVTSKEVSAADRAALNRNPGRHIHVVEKAGFNSARFIAEVRRTLLAQ